MELIEKRFSASSGRNPTGCGMLFSGLTRAKVAKIAIRQRKLPKNFHFGAGKTGVHLAILNPVCIFVVWIGIRRVPLSAG